MAECALWPGTTLAPVRGERSAAVEHPLAVQASAGGLACGAGGHVVALQFPSGPERFRAVGAAVPPLALATHVAV